MSPQSISNLGTRLSFNSRLRDHISANLAGLDLRRIDTTGKKHAAVAITLTNCNASADIGDIPFSEVGYELAAFILTIRATKLKHHAGQRAFPGGRIDTGETPEQTALRELMEEVGLSLDARSILGKLDDYATRSGFVITPVVVWGGTDLNLTANPGEVESIHRIPVSELLRGDSPILESIPESDNPVIKMPLGNDWFAAPTAAIAYQFREVAILGKNTRVAHFEQPLFAWK
ncbi:MAG: CoA pyrophosphatase [Gammaproteobacteria bacterium]|nr:CoA pyrophosphatase [Gammaproteobacteria bacterium]